MNFASRADDFVFQLCWPWDIVCNKGGHSLFQPHKSLEWLKSRSLWSAIRWTLCPCPGERLLSFGIRFRLHLWHVRMIKESTSIRIPQTLPDSSEHPILLCIKKSPHFRSTYCMFTALLTQYSADGINLIWFMEINGQATVR